MEKDRDKIEREMERDYMFRFVISHIYVCNTDFFSHDIIQYDLGGPWYTEQEFDHEFVEELCNFIVQFVNSKGMIDLSGRDRKRKRVCL